MEWGEIKDPNKQFVFDDEIWNLVSDEYSAQEIQDMINNDGVRNMVAVVNHHFQNIKKVGKILQIKNSNGIKTIGLHDTIK